MVCLLEYLFLRDGEKREGDNVSLRDRLRNITNERRGSNDNKKVAESIVRRAGSGSVLGGSNNRTTSSSSSGSSGSGGGSTYSSPDLARSFNQDARGNVTYKDPAVKDSSGSILDPSNSSLSQRINTSRGGNYFEERDGNTVRTDVRDDWQAGQAYTPDVKPSVVDGFREGQTSEGDPYQYGYTQASNYINPNTGFNVRVGQNQRDGMLYNAVGTDAERNFINTGLMRTYQSPQDQKVAHSDPAMFDDNFTVDGTPLKIGSQAHRNQFFSQYPDATPLDYIDYVGIPHQYQDEFARNERLNNPYGQRKHDDLVANRMYAEDGDPYGYENWSLANQLKKGKVFQDEEGNFDPRDLSSEEMGALYRKLMGDDTAHYNPEEYESFNIGGVVDSDHARGIDQDLQERRAMQEPNLDYTDYINRYNEDVRMREEPIEPTPQPKPERDPMAEYYNHMSEQQRLISEQQERERREVEDARKREEELRELEGKYSRGGSEGIRGSGEVSGNPEVQSALSSRYLRDQVKEYGKEVETPEQLEEFMKRLRIKERSEGGEG